MKTESNPLTRRKLLAGAACVTLAGVTDTRVAMAEGPESGSPPASTFLEILRLPDKVTAYSGLMQPHSLTRGGMRWQGDGIEIQTEASAGEMPVLISAPAVALTHVHIRWNASVASNLLMMGDQWERSYGDLEWRGFEPERVMPWYFLTFGGDTCHGYGVKTGGGALCFWQADPAGISLWLNLCNGGEGVLLGRRTLAAATVVTRKGQSGEALLAAATAFCRTMCDRPRLPKTAIYGSNDWYYAYGKSSAAQILRDAELMSALAPAKGDRPFTIADEGWDNPAAFPDMSGLAAQIRRRNVRPGIWIRPLLAAADTSPAWLLPGARFGAGKERASEMAYDPTVPEALAAALGKLTQVTGWGYELVKHDFSTYDLFGQWGFEMGPEPTLPGWHFHDRSKTNAEIIRGFYEALRRAAGERTILVGCNTVGHLGAGLFEAQRTGDDVSGKLWERTRRMGVNTLAYRLPQHKTFFLQDPDCIPFTQEIPWEDTRQWLDVVARSGVVLLVSPGPGAVGPEQSRSIQEAFSMSAAGVSTPQAIDCLQNTTPGKWQFDQGSSSTMKQYDWYNGRGAWPFQV